MTQPNEIMRIDALMKVAFMPSKRQYALEMCTIPTPPQWMVDGLAEREMHFRQALRHENLTHCLPNLHQIPFGAE